MITFECLLHWTLLMAYFAIRFAIEVVFLHLPFHVDLLPAEYDVVAHRFIFRMVDSFCFCRWLARSTFLFLAERPLPLALILFIIKHNGWFNQIRRQARRSWKSHVVLWAAHKIISRTKLREDDLWRILQTFITFTRVHTGRGYIEGKHTYINRRRALPKSMVSAFILGLIVIAISMSDRVRTDTRGFKRLQKGFTARIPSCYDGDTCYLEASRQPKAQRIRCELPSDRYRVVPMDARLLSLHSFRIDQHQFSPQDLLCKKGSGSSHVTHGLRDSSCC